jgi:hypothetical protein
MTKNKPQDNRNTPPLTVSCAPSGDEGPAVYIKITTKKINKTNKLFRLQIKNTPVGFQMYRRIRRIEIQNPICVVERMSQRKSDGL